jgi:hypothetical protein
MDVRRTELVTKFDMKWTPRSEGSDLLSDMARMAAFGAFQPLAIVRNDARSAAASRDVRFPSVGDVAPALGERLQRGHEQPVEASL